MSLPLAVTDACVLARAHARWVRARGRHTPRGDEKKSKSSPKKRDRLCLLPPPWRGSRCVDRAADIDSLSMCVRAGERAPSRDAEMPAAEKITPERFSLSPESRTVSAPYRRAAEPCGGRARCNTHCDRILIRRARKPTARTAARSSGANRSTR